MKKHTVKLLAILFVLAIFGAASCMKAQSNTIVTPTQKESLTSVPNAKLDGAIIRPLVKEKVEPEKTTWTYEDAKGLSYPVFRSATGKLFYYKKAVSTGKEYKAYITLAQ
jgi:hypothetical protein